MDAVKEVETDREIGVRIVDNEATVPTSIESSSAGKSSQVSDHKSDDYVSNVLIDTVPRVNKGGAIRGKRKMNKIEDHFTAQRVQHMYVRWLVGCLSLMQSHVCCVKMDESVTRTVVQGQGLKVA